MVEPTHTFVCNSCTLRRAYTTQELDILVVGGSATKKKVLTASFEGEAYFVKCPYCSAGTLSTRNLTPFLKQRKYDFTCLNSRCNYTATVKKEDILRQCKKVPASIAGYHEYYYICAECGGESNRITLPDSNDQENKYLNVQNKEQDKELTTLSTLTEKEQGRLDRAKKIAETLNAKNKAYGDSFAKSGAMLSILFPDISKERATVILAVARIIDKLFRIANDPTAFGEDPAMDIAGYGMLLQELVSNE